MLEQQSLVDLLVKLAVAASVASILTRFTPIEKMLFRDERTLNQRLGLAFSFALIFGAGAAARILTRNSYRAIDLAMEASIIAGMLGGYVSGLITGICVSIPAMFAGEFMAMPMFSAAGVVGGLLHDLAPEKADIWRFSPFLDLSLYRLVRQGLQLKRTALNLAVMQRAGFHIVCALAIIGTEFIRVAIARSFSHGTFSLAKTWSDPGWFSWAALYVTTIFAIALPLKIWNSFRTERQLELEQARLTEARLAALTNQINPHFLFNTLNSVSTLIRLDPDKARNVVYRLSHILRRLLRKTENLTTLREELSFIDDYLAIEMVRFGDKLKFQKEIDEQTLDRLIPSMILQPIVENSIKHGLSNKVEGGVIRLRTSLVGTRLHVLVEDDGVGIAEAKLATLFEQGIGVSNVNERLRVLFGSSYRMWIDSKPGEGTKTGIEIPELDNRLAASASKSS